MDSDRSEELKRFIAGITRRRDAQEAPGDAGAASVVGNIQSFSGNLIIMGETKPNDLAKLLGANRKPSRPRQ